MRRGLVAVAAAALLCGLCILALRGMIASGQSVQDIVLLSAGATLTLSAIAVGFATRALLRSNAVYRDLAQLTRSVDSAMRELSARGDRETASIGELSTLVTRELELFSSRAPTRQKHASDDAPQRDNIVALSASRRPRPDGVETPAAAAAAAAAVAVAVVPTEQAGFELAVQRAFVSGSPELSLQPIVSISQGAATGFEVFLHVMRDDGMAVDLQRLPSSLPNLSQAAFERWLAIGALDAAGKQAGLTPDGLPLYVQVSEALLADSDELNTVLDALRHSRADTQRLVLSLPSSILERNARHAEAIELLVDTGVNLAAENWTGNKDSLEKLKRSGVSLVKLSADRLLGRIKPAKAANTAIRLVEIASALDIPVIAVNVANDEDAVSLIDLGINLMTGSRFSGPRRLKPNAARQDKVASM
jgi:cyclic-di-GMP phosphodiesterase TipF (flagellum assembly factor)